MEFGYGNRDAYPPGVKFHNGQELTADDVAYTLNFAANPDNKVKTQRYSSWIDHVGKTGPYSVKIMLKTPFPPAFEFLSNANPIYPKSYYEEVGPEGFGPAPIGTGPYKIPEVVPGEKMVMVKNDDYFKESPKGQPSIGKIVWRTLPEINIRMAELMTGGLDWIFLVPPDQAAMLATNPDLTVTPAETMRVGFLQFDSADRSGKEHNMDNPFAKLEVRQAVNHAINKESISKNLVGGQSRPIVSACFPSQFGCEQDVKTYEYNPEKARELLAKAGYPDGFETVLHGYRDRPYAEAMIGDLAAVGIKAKLLMMQYSALREKFRAGKVPLQFLSWGSYSINDVSAITSYYFEFEAEDLARDPVVRDLLLEGDSSIDPAKRKAAYSKALKRIAEQAYRTARAKGLRWPKILFKHTLRNAIIPVAALAAVQLGFMLGGSIVIESIFALNGLGNLAWVSIARSDLPVVQAIVLFLSTTYISLTFLGDLLNAFLDPRIRSH